MLRVRDLTFGYNGRPLVSPISFEMKGGELWALLGPNGCGKTTLLKTALGLISPIGGRIVWAAGTRPGYVPQRATLDLSVPARTVDIVRGGTERGWSFLNPLHRWSARQAVRRTMREVHVTRLIRQQFRELSEGQKQRVLMGRALASEPSVLVLDEPTAALDITAERGIFQLIDELRRSRDLAVVLVSHHVMLVAAHASHAVVMDRDHGWVVAGTIEEVARDDRVHELYGNLLEDALAGREGDAFHGH